MTAAPDLSMASADGLELRFEYPDAEAYAGTVTQLVEERIASRMTSGDATLWGPEAESEAAIRLGWVHLAESSRPLVDDVLALRESLRNQGLDHIVLAGMGGSSLAPEVICATEGVALVTLDTTDAGQVRAALSDSLDRTVLVVSSKSGGTVETDSHRRVYEHAFRENGIDPAERIFVVTDPGSPLQQNAEQAGYRVFLADPNVGGRYSALTAFGLVPSGLAGADISRLLDEASATSGALAADSPANPGLRLGALLGDAHNAGSDKVVFGDFGSGLPGFGDWAEQLIAESTGKQGKGLLPVVVENPQAPGFVDAREDAILTHLGEFSPDYRAKSGWAAGASGPLGAQFLLWEYATAFAGQVIGINPFDQPNVEEAKKQARALLESPPDAVKPQPAFREGAVEVYPLGFDLGGASTLAEALEVFFSTAPELGYISIQAYLNRIADSSAANTRPEVARRTGLQTTFGWGPRFLHSTGQYHKGGHPNGVFLQITGVVVEDLAVPDRPYTFGVLQAAQAAGDAAVLVANGRPVLHLHLTDRAAGIGQLLQVL
jgi:hypothetical protein